MTEPFSFQPPRKRGLLILGGAALILATTSAVSFLFGLEQSNSELFVGLLLISLIFFAPLPLISYRAYSLLRASYRLERNGLRLRWGLRAEDIPLPEIEWARKVTDLAVNLPPPRLVWPGTLRGTVQVNDLGPVEYMASNRENLILVATTRKIYAISPENPDNFLLAFQRSLEMGSLTPISSVSVMPAAYLSQVWTDKIARWLVSGGFLLAVSLFTGSGLVIPSRSVISLGFYPDGQALPPVPPEQLLLLPILGAFVFLTDLAFGLFLFRRPPSRLIAYLLWGSGLLTQVLFLIALIFLTLVSA